ncbi:hypothetical protein QZH41_004579 [Actinostola sp. cb2023]|nr:hypothetical protein QZH41_004579 [Actinostola sp. cb2023]
MQELEKTHNDVNKAFQDGFHVVRRSDRYWAGLSTDLIIEQVLMHSVKTTGELTRGRGMTETQRLVWLMSMPACAEVNSAMQSLTGVYYQTSKQHKDTTTARKQRDHNDIQELTSYLRLRNPFTDDPSLRSIVTGVVADENVNVDNAKEVGDRILVSMEGKRVQDFSFRKKDQAVTLASKTAVTFADGIVQVDPQLLFQRLSVVATGGRFENPQEFFKFEMCSYPPALFDSSLLPRQANKPVLADAMWVKSKEKQTGRPTGDVHYVVDGGALLHRVSWPRGIDYETIFTHYVEYVERKYGKATVVFDGYEDGPGTKDCTHQRRTGTCGPTVNFSSNMIFQSKKEDFLANKVNKQRFINFLSERLQAARCTSAHAVGDADLLIVQTAVESARYTTTALVGDDTDLLVLLCFHADMEMHDLFFMPEPRHRSTKPRRIWNIKETKLALGPSVCANILFVHAILGCDTISRVHGLGKGVALKKVADNAEFRDQALVFIHSAASREDVIKAGEKALVCLYNGKVDENLDFLRYTRFWQKVATGTIGVQPESLPPTSAAAAYHSLRAYFQVQQWNGNQELQPEDWGWKLTEGKLLPVHTDLPPAHDSLLEMIRCNCKSNCSTQRCTCKKHGLDCSPACGVCKGQSCANSLLPDLDAGLQEDD